MPDLLVHVTNPYLRDLVEIAVFFSGEVICYQAVTRYLNSLMEPARLA